VDLHLAAVEAPGTGPRRAVSSPGPHALGPLAVTLVDEGAGRLAWSVANRGDAPVAVRSVAVVWTGDVAGAPLRMLRNGWQSWSPSAVATVGVDRDPSAGPAVPALVRQTHHPDADPVVGAELRSELVTVLADRRDAVLVGFLGGDRHDGTVRVRPGVVDDTVEVRAEAYLGGAVLAPGERRDLHPVEVVRGEPHGLLEGWAGRFGVVAAARVGSPYLAGWCSWYHYFTGVTEADVRANLVRAADWPVDVFQVDDGYQRAIGDWLVTDPSFPSDLADLAGAIAAAGRRPGIWMAPFLAHPDSRVAGAHPEWFARWGEGDKRLVGNVAPHWGGNVHVLDTTHPEVLDHLERTAAALVDAGWTYLKLDFTYAPAIAGRYHDPSRTPAQRVRAGYDAVRRGAGDDAFLLGCGCPLGPAVGVVDGMRIGPDVGPWWTNPRAGEITRDYAGGEPATVNAWRSTLVRSFLHRRWWLNDPDCLMLRSEATDLSPAAARAWATAVGASGGMALVSDDLALLGADARRLLDEVVALGREVDALAAAGAAVRCPDLLERGTPSRLECGPVRLVADLDDPDGPTARVERG
jgi:alpha-galactosidase